MMDLLEKKEVTGTVNHQNFGFERQGKKRNKKNPQNYCFVIVRTLPFV
jgi:hypothetical protein